ncbi:MAG: MarR family transcriptional regulator [Bdellovibrionales bacterium]|nr:MarR family transcriptional regulator [Bdellovibrionales bacterium]
MKSLGILALGSRLRALSDALFRDVQQIYCENGIEFSPRFFPVLAHLHHHGSSSVGELAQALGVTHARVSQMVASLEQSNLVSLARGKEDVRRTEISLTRSATTLLKRIEPIWSKMRSHLERIISEEAPGFDVALDQLETALSSCSFHDRVQNVTSQEGIEFLLWSPEYCIAFRDLNTDWIEKYFELEEEDRKTLSDPQKKILNSGGMVFFAKLHGAVVGTCALVKKSDRVYELVKMAISPLAQGRGIGKALLKFAESWAMEQGAQSIELETSSKLKAALRLYTKNGYRRTPIVHESHYERVDVAMKKQLS